MKETDTDLVNMSEIDLGPEKEIDIDLEKVKEKGITGRDVKIKLMNMKGDTTVSTDIVIAALGVTADMAGRLAEDPQAGNQSGVTSPRIVPDMTGNP